MSKIDEKYIEALDNFTDALEQIVETLKEQQRTGKADVVNEFLKQPMDNLVTVVKDLKKVTMKGFAELKTDNQKILKKIESIKQQKEAGMFDRVEDPKNKNKIVDGIKVVILIAAGVLALGMAFKIIGKVDFISVMALSVAMVAISFAFSKIAGIKDLTFRKVLTVSSIIPLMAAGLALSGYILRGFPTITLMQGLSMMVIGGALGVATYLLFKSLGKISLKSLLIAPLIPLILPLVAWGIVKASEILKNVQTLTLKQVLSVGLVGLALGVATFGISLALKGLKNVTWKEMLMLPLMIPLIAWSIVKASSIFQKFEPIKQPAQLLIGSAVIGLSLLFFSPSIFILGKLSLGTILKGSLAIIPLAWAIVQSSIIFQAFIPLRFPLQIITGSIAMGLAILMFTPAFWIIDKFKLKVADILKGSFAILAISSAVVLASIIFQAFIPLRSPLLLIASTLTMGISILLFSGVFWLLDKMKIKQGDVIKNSLIILAIAGVITATSWIFQLGKFDKYPSLKWSLGAGLSVLAFGAAGVALGLLMMTGVGAVGLAAGIAAILAIAGSIVGVSLIFQKGKYDKYPSLKWSASVGASILAFSLATVAAVGAGIVGLVGRLFTGGKDPLIRIVQSMVDVANKLNEVNWSTAKLPTKAYAEGVGGLLLTFANIFAKISLVEGFNKIMSLFGGGDKSFTKFIDNATDAIVRSKNKLDEVNWSSSNYPKKEYAEGVGNLLLIFADIFSKISKIQGFNTIINKLFGGKSTNFTTFIDNATDSITRANNKLSGVNWSSNFPTKEYAEGVGGLLVAFADVFWKISKVEGFNLIISKLTKTGESDSFTVFIEKAADAMRIANDKIGKVSWTNNFPKKEFSEGVGNLLVSFADSYSKVTKKTIFGRTDTFTGFINHALDSILRIRKKLGDIEWSNVKYPSEAYTNSIGSFLNIMAESYSKLSGKGLFGVGKKTMSLKEFVEDSSTSIVLASNILQKGNFTNIPSSEWSGSLGKMIVAYSIMLNNIIYNKKEKTKSEDIQLLIKDIVSIANILNLVDWTSSKYPSKDWIKNVSDTVVDYASINLKSTSILKTKLAIKEVINDIIDVANKLNKFDWSNAKYPDKNWVNNISNAISDYSSINLKSITVLSKLVIKDVIDDIIDIANKLNDFDWNSTNYPSKEWINNISNIIKSYSNLKGFEIDPNIKDIIKSIIETSEKFNFFDWNTVQYPSKDWIENISTIVKGYTSLNNLELESNIKEIINNIIGVAKSLNNVDWTTIKYPSKEWMNIISDILNIYMTLPTNLQENSHMKNIIDNIVDIANSLNFIDWNTIKYPTKDYIDNFSYLILESNKLMSSINLATIDGFVNFSKNSSKAISQTSLILGNGKYDNFPDHEYISNFSYFMIVISDLIEKYDFNAGKSNKFLNSSNLLAPAIKNWIETVSKLDSNNLPSKSSSDIFVYSIDIIGGVITNWKVTVKESSNFEDSMKFIVSSIKQLLTIPEVKPIFSDSMNSFKIGVKDVGQGIYDFKKLKLSLNDLEEFSKSTKFIITAIQELVRVPNVNYSLVNNMKIIKNALAELIEGVDSFMYEKNGFNLKGAFNLVTGAKTKRSMTDFNLFSNELKSLASSLQVLSALKPIPSGIIPNYSAFLSELGKMPDMPNLDTKISGITKLSNSFLTLANSLSKVNESLEGFISLSKGLSIINTIDETKFDKVLKSVDKYKSTLQIVNKEPEPKVNLLKPENNQTETYKTNIESEKKEQTIVKEENKNDSQFYNDISEIKMLLNEIVDHLDKPSQSGSFYK